MKENKQPKKKTKWVRRPSPLALKILLAVVIVFSMVAMAALWQVHRAIQDYTQEIQKEVADLEYANSDLEGKVANPDSAQNIKDVAQDELGLVDPNTIIIDSGPAGTE